ncbi:MAG: hypothetical protein U1F68_06360 [Gammaproteobacteria bacterium]
MKNLAFLLAALGSLISVQANALCDVSQARVVHAESSPFNNAAASRTIFWIAQASTAPVVYYVFATSNQMFINHLNAAHSANLQVRVTGNAAACGAAGTLRTGGEIVAVFRDSFF